MTQDTKSGTIKMQSWKDVGFGPSMKRETQQSHFVTGEYSAQFIAGESFDIRLDEMKFNRMLQFRGLYKKPQGNDPGKVYYDPVTKKLKMWIDTMGQWAEILYTTTSMSTSTTSSSSTSTTTT